MTAHVQVVLDEQALGPLRKHRDWFTTGDLARECGTTLRAIRHYEKLGLIRASGRSAGRHRVFAPSEREKTRLISDLRQLGVGLRAIGDLFGARGRSGTGGEASRRVVEMVAQQVGALERKIARLRGTRGDLVSLARRLHVCAECDAPLREERCHECKRADRSDRPRLFRLLWLREGESLPACVAGPTAARD